MQIIVTKVISEREIRGRGDDLARGGDVYRDTDEPGEGNPLPAGTGGGAEPQVERETQPCVIETASIRCYYPRHHGRQGTRLTFNDGGGFAVLDDFEMIARACGALPVAEAADRAGRLAS